MLLYLFKDWQAAFDKNKSIQGWYGVTDSRIEDTDVLDRRVSLERADEASVLESTEEVEIPDLSAPALPYEPEQNLAFSCPVDHAGTAVYVQGWARMHSEWPPVIFVHDLGENVELYDTAARFLGQQGFNTYSFDMRGHGRSTPLAGRMLDFKDLVNDLLQVVAWIRYKSQRRTPFLISQGVGALLLLHFQKAYPQYTQSCILLAPVFQDHAALPLFSRSLIHIMALLAPRGRLPRFLLPYFLPMSDDAQLRGSESALMISAGFAHELLGAIRSAPDYLQSIVGRNLIVNPIDDSFFNSSRLRDLIAAQNREAYLEVLELPGISAQALTHDADEVGRLLSVLIPWMQQNSTRTPAI
jgi:pimeloyl-ACP methyl ester carboxylesterase